MNEILYWLTPAFFIIAMLYASVGFGGGSSYVALLYLAGIEIFTLRSTALICNIVVVIGGTYLFYKNGYLNLKKCLPLIVASIPMAYLGGYLPLPPDFIFILLGISLLLSSIILWQQTRSGNKTISEEITTYPFQWKSTGWGAGLGLLSGAVGIGGGIFLSPILNLSRWGNPKSIAATASFFILANSIAGLLGQWTQLQLAPSLKSVWPLLLAVFIGGQIGTRLAIIRFSPQLLKRTTAILVGVASLKILYDHLMG